MVDTIIAVIDNFGFDNWYDIGDLTFTGVFSEDLAVFGDSFVGRGEDIAVTTETDFEGGAPFGKTETHLIVFL